MIPADATMQQSLEIFIDELVSDEELRDAFLRNPRRTLGPRRRMGSTRSLARRIVPKIFPLLLRSPLLPRIQRRIFFGAPLPPLDPAFSFRTVAT